MDFPSFTDPSPKFQRNRAPGRGSRSRPKATPRNSTTAPAIAVASGPASAPSDGTNARPLSADAVDVAATGAVGGGVPLGEGEGDAPFALPSVGEEAMPQDALEPLSPSWRSAMEFPSALFAMLKKSPATHRPASTAVDSQVLRSELPGLW